MLIIRRMLYRGSCDIAGVCKRRKFKFLIDMGKYKQDYHYLVKQAVPYNTPIIKIFVLCESDLCYHIKRENGHRSWELKSDWDAEYVMIEDLGENYNK